MKVSTFRLAAGLLFGIALLVAVLVVMFLAAVRSFWQAQ
jgi:hypothetical protein